MDPVQAEDLSDVGVPPNGFIHRTYVVPAGGNPYIVLPPWVRRLMVWANPDSGNPWDFQCAVAFSTGPGVAPAIGSTSSDVLQLVGQLAPIEVVFQPCGGIARRAATWSSSVQGGIAFLMYP